METEPSEAAIRPALNWKVVLAYDGTDFRGWQVQPGLNTIQGNLADALYRVTGETVLPQGSGRTDSGVHAFAQVASFALHAPIPAASLVRALNQTLPEAIRILSAIPVESDFHARHSTRTKTYEYRVIVCDPFQEQVCPPWLSRFSYVVNRPLNLAALQAAAVHIIGEMDFTSFAASDPDRNSRLALLEGDSDRNNIRHIQSSSWTLQDASTLGPSNSHLPVLTYSVNGNGFLHHMVRNLVGTFLEVGWGSRPPGEITAILAARERSRAGRTAPARGLFLHHVDY